MKKGFLLIVFLIQILFVFTSNAQTEEQVILRCIYSGEYRINPDNYDKIRYDETALDIGKNTSAFYSIDQRAYNQRLDSLLALGLDFNGVMNGLADMPRTFNYIEVYKNIPEKDAYTYFDKALISIDSYKEKLPDLQWKISSESKTILEYKCQKATTEYAGRKWTVWFAQDIPFSDGPWIFTGLPGLILEAADDEDLFHYKCTEISTNLIDTYVHIPNRRKYTECTRKEFLDLRKRYWEDPQGTTSIIMGFPVKHINTDGTNTVQVQNRNFLEKEW